MGLWIKCVLGGCLVAWLCVGGAASLTRSLPWDGPASGPVRQPGKKITFISQDFRNGGISAAYRGFFTAARQLGWAVSLLNGEGDTATIRGALITAIQQHQDAIVLGGFDPSAFSDELARARQAKIVLIGWHAAAEPGPTPDLFVNVATHSAAVATLAAQYAIGSGNGGGKIGVIIFTDQRFAVASAKAQRMAQIVHYCRRCQLLAVENVAIPDAGTIVPQIVPRLNRLYGKQWTRTLAINDVYFDAINVPLRLIHRGDILNVSAGDGSDIALSRIKSGKSQQIATVAEPAGLQGWQMADELNRAFAGQPPSGYVSQPILVTTGLLRHIDGAPIDGDIPYREAYGAIWRGGYAQ